MDIVYLTAVLESSKSSRNLETLKALEHIKHTAHNSQIEICLTELKKLLTIVSKERELFEQAATRDNYYGDLLPNKLEEERIVQIIVKKVNSLTSDKVNV
ncbi:MAG: hypothetical protein [Grapevine pararetrovirus]|nr:MAG: hypothetical protein [Grapevine pararetrovirus]